MPDCGKSVISRTKTTRKKKKGLSYVLVPQPGAGAVPMAERRCDLKLTGLLAVLGMVLVLDLTTDSEEVAYQLHAAQRQVERAKGHENRHLWRH